MFSIRDKPLSQAVISNDSIEKLERLPETVSGFFDAHEISDGSPEESGREKSISELRFGLKGVSFKARVVKKSEIRAVTSKDGNPLVVCSVTLSDGTGEIPVAIWNSQIAAVREGDLVQIHDARVRSFRGEKQLALSRKTGGLIVLEPEMNSPST